METHGQKRVLNAGSGPASSVRLRAGFRQEDWIEIRLDVDPRTNPDVVSSMCDMRDVIADASVDAVWTSHSIEHLHAHEVGQAFREFRRVLKADGFVLATCPDIKCIANLILQYGLEADVYQSPAGPIKPLDMLYGHSRSIGAGQNAMTHNTGFTADRIGRLALECGFSEARVIEGLRFDLWALLMMPETDLTRVSRLFENMEIAPLFSVDPPRDEAAEERPRAAVAAFSF